MWCLTYLHTDFQLVPQAVYPVGVTEVQLGFTHKITYNSSIVDQIYPNCDTGIHQLAWSVHTWIIVILQSVQND